MDTRNAIFFAKSPDANGHQETVGAHLRKVAELAAVFGAETGQEAAARLAGLWHDFGKYSRDFQEVLLGVRHGVDHALPGAAFLDLAGGERLRAVVEAVNGHHDALRSRDALLPALRESLRSESPLRCPSGKDASLRGKAAYTRARNAFQRDFPDFRLSDLRLPEEAFFSEEARMLYTRMLFSCLVDADYCVSAATQEGQAAGVEAVSPPAWEAALEALEAYRRSLRRTSSADPALNALRDRLFCCCGEAGAGESGLYTLTAPTGTGKTLALLNFALRQRKRRIIIVLPFLSLIEQSAREYARIIPDILEDHSQREYGDEHREFCARWEHPFIITTSVRFFEALFRWQPGDLRKLHNIAQSVIVFDEAQSLPGQLTQATLRAVGELCARYGCSVVFSTATQPNFAALSQVEWKPREICPWNESLYTALRRTRVKWRVQRPMPLEAVAGEMARSQSVCCIVNLRRHAARLYKQLTDLCPAEECFFLTTDLCPAHRSALIDRVRERLRQGLACRVVSTQCIEAGVDLDFARMYRALAPLEAIIQAAGRCNRNGRLAGGGEVCVFIPDEEGRLYPGDAYERAAMRVLEMLSIGEIDIHDPAHIAEYYRRLFEDVRDDPALTDAVRRRSYEEVSEHYRLIDDRAVQVIVPYAGQRALFESVRQELQRSCVLAPQLLRTAAPITVSAFDRARCERCAEALFLPARRGEPPRPSGYYLLRPQHEGLYTEEMGLQWPEEHGDINII